MEHKNKTYKWFASRYNLDKLVRYQKFCSIDEAIIREKELKWWIRSKKIALIEQMNLVRDDLFSQ